MEHNDKKSSKPVYPAGSISIPLTLGPDKLTRQPSVKKPTKYCTREEDNMGLQAISAANTLSTNKIRKKTSVFE